MRLGLGAESPVITLRAVDFLRQLYPLCEEHLAQDDEWIRNAYIVRKMVAQEFPPTGTFNWRHGGIYLSAGQISAVRYAVNNCYGSEVISIALLCYLKLRAVIADTLDRLRLSDAPITRLLNLEPTPVLVTVRGVRVGTLRSEHGGDPSEVIAAVESDVGEGSDPEGNNFEAIEPIAPSYLSLHSIRVTGGHMYIPQFELQPYAKS